MIVPAHVLELALYCSIDSFTCERCGSPTAAGEEGGRQRSYPNSSRAPSGKRGRRLGAGAWLDVSSPINLPIGKKAHYRVVTFCAHETALRARLGIKVLVNLNAWREGHP